MEGEGDVWNEWNSGEIWMCNESILRDFLLLKLMKNDNLDEIMMEKAS